MLGDREHEALVHGALGHAIKLDLGDLEDGDAHSHRNAHGLTPAIIGLDLGLRVQRRCRDSGAQRLDHRVTASKDASRATAR